MTISDEELMDILRSRLNHKSSTLKEIDMFRELEKLSNRLKRSEKMKSNFLSNIRNEVNNPISSVLGLSRALLNTERLDATQIERYAFLIHHEIFYLDFQMKNIFAAAEIEAGEMKIEPAIVDVKQLIRHLLQTLLFRAEKKGVTIQTTCLSSEILFCTDSHMLHLIALNLLANAIEFTKENTVVEVELHGEKQLRISVRDRGQGILAEDHGRIFERFSQLDEGTTKQHAGQGLGLSIIGELVELLSGKLAVNSRVGEGSEFVVELPSLDMSNPDNATQSSDWNEFLFDNDTVL